MLAVGVVVLLVGHFLHPIGTFGYATYLVIMLGATTGAWAGALHRPRVPSRVPVLIAAGITANTLAEVTFFIIHVWAGVDPNVSLADVFFFLSYVGLAAALVLGTTARSGDGLLARLAPDSVIDTLTILVVSLLIFWELQIGEILTNKTISGFTRIVWASYPVLDAILLAIVARTLVTRRTRSSGGWAFACGLGCWLVSDIGQLWTGPPVALSLQHTGWLLGAVLMATSVWRRPDPAAAHVAAEAPLGHPLGRLGIATAPIAVPLVLHFVDDQRGGERSGWPTAISVTLLLGLSFIRNARLLQSESRAHIEARASRDDALAASRAKSEFLATMSHEIRTPMNGVIGLTGLLQSTPLDQRQRQYVDGVHLAGEALLRIINDILDFSKIEAGRLELDIIDFNLVQVVEEAAELVAQPAHDKGIELLAYCSPELPLSLRGDPSRLRQVLLNLASNAVKFTDRGEVVLRAQLDSMTSDGPVVRFEVVDTGIGLESADRERLFQPFSQADSSTTRRFGGTGLGLAICRQLVTAMGGELGVESERGRGSTFWFTLPLAVAVAQTAAPEVRPASGLTGLRVLIVDDNRTSSVILSGQLAAWGIDPVVAQDGPAALVLLEAAVVAQTPYALALVDLCMPGMDGLELAGCISRRPALAGLGVVLLTTVPGVSVTEARAHGISVRLAKPVHLARLHDALLEVSRGSHAAPSRSPAPKPARSPGTRGHVLIVEDNHVNQLVAVAMLENLGFSTEVAGNGLEALDSYRRNPFVAVLMDCQMPEMDGYDATVEIRRLEEGGARTPVIAMTAGASQSEHDQCLRAGMDDYLTKPVNELDLDATLSRWLVSTPAQSD